MHEKGEKGQTPRLVSHPNTPEYTRIHAPARIAHTRTRPRTRNLYIPWNSIDYHGFTIILQLMVAASDQLSIVAKPAIETCYSNQPASIERGYTMRYHDNEAVEMTVDDLEFLEEQAGAGDSLIRCPVCGALDAVSMFVGAGISSLVCINGHRFEAQGE